MSDITEWYWDLEKSKAVTADERGPGDHMLGPYPTKGDAENWKSRVEARNDEWDDADNEWSERNATDRSDRPSN